MRKAEIDLVDQVIQAAKEGQNITPDQMELTKALLVKETAVATAMIERHGGCWWSNFGYPVNPESAWEGLYFRNFEDFAQL